MYPLMPRNPHKTRCSVPGCHNWAMRDRETGEPALCRSHRDAELGPRGAGAPQGNLNALVHGRHSNPLSPPDLEHLVAVAVDRPDDLPLEIGLAVRSIHARTGHALLTLIALRRLLSQVVAQLSARFLRAELRAELRTELRAELRHRSAAFDSPGSSHAAAHASCSPDQPLPRLLTPRLRTRLARSLSQRASKAGSGSSQKQKKP